MWNTVSNSYFTTRQYSKSADSKKNIIKYDNMIEKEGLLFS